MGSKLESEYERLRHSPLAAAAVAACLFAFLAFLGYLAWGRTADSNIGSAGAGAVSGLLGAMINPKPSGGGSGSQFEIPRPAWLMLVAAAFALTVIGAVLILVDAKYVNAAAALLAGIAAVGGLLISPPKPAVSIVPVAPAPVPVPVAAQRPADQD